MTPTTLPPSPHGAIGTRGWWQTLPLLPLLVIALAMFAATGFTFMQTDDFCAFGRVNHRFGGNPFLDTYALYNEWTGRYSSGLLVALVATAGLLTSVEWAYPIALASFMGLFGWACWNMSRLPGDGVKPDAAIALVLFASTLLLVPSKLEQLLWLTGASVYFVGGSILMLLVAALGGRHSPRSTWPQEATLLAGIVLAVGFNELLAVVAGACVGWSALAELLRTHRLSRRQWVRIGVFALSLVTTVIAPGNFVRDAGSVTPRHDIPLASALAWDGTSRLLVAVVNEHAWALAASVLAAFSAGAMSRRPGRVSAGHWVPYALILIAAVPMHFWVYSFLTGEITPGRIVNQAFMLAHVSLLLLVAVTGMYAGISRWPASLGLGLAGVLLVASPDFRGFVGTLRTFAPGWHSHQLARHRGFEAIGGTEQTAYVAPFPYGDASPPIFKGADITSDPENWMNRCVADYYRVREVVKLRSQ